MSARHYASSTSKLLQLQYAMSAWQQCSVDQIPGLLHTVAGQLINHDAEKAALPNEEVQATSAATAMMIASALPCDLVRAIAAAATATASLLALSTPPEGVVSMGLGEAAPEAGVDPDPPWGCCSCWAFAAAALFSCTHRMAMWCQHLAIYIMRILYVLYTYILYYVYIICILYT